jgi:hypothetical protein
MDSRVSVVYSADCRVSVLSSPKLRVSIGSSLVTGVSVVSSTNSGASVVFSLGPRGPEVAPPCCPSCSEARDDILRASLTSARNPSRTVGPSSPEVNIRVRASSTSWGPVDGA